MRSCLSLAACIVAGSTGSCGKDSRSDRRALSNLAWSKVLGKEFRPFFLSKHRVLFTEGQQRTDSKPMNQDCKGKCRCRLTPPSWHPRGMESAWQLPIPSYPNLRHDLPHQVMKTVVCVPKPMLVGNYVPHLQAQFQAADAFLIVERWEAFDLGQWLFRHFLKP